MEMKLSLYLPPLLTFVGAISNTHYTKNTSNSIADRNSSCKQKFERFVLISNKQMNDKVQKYSEKIDFLCINLFL